MVDSADLVRGDSAPTQRAILVAQVARLATARPASVGRCGDDGYGDDDDETVAVGNTGTVAADNDDNETIAAGNTSTVAAGNADNTDNNNNTPPQLHELRELTLSAGAEVCAAVVARRNRPIAATFIGVGKAQEIAELVARHHADLVIFDNPISPIQERNLERIINCRVLDRTGLILDIFAQRATSSEGKLQVELAQLQHLSTRLVRGWSHLERQKGGVGLRGPGETQLETDRRLIGIRIQSLTRALRRVESQRALRRRGRRRAELPTISLVGYTNAGKSSLFNRLVAQAGDAKKPAVHTADQLFATLDPTMRRVQIPGYGAAVLSDTVGFIRDLPHALINAFHSTLEELASASCLLLVNDYADPDFAEIRRAVRHVLHEIGAHEVPVINVNNKNRPHRRPPANPPRQSRQSRHRLALGTQRRRHRFAPRRPRRKPRQPPANNTIYA